jgi:hypothetical protein
VSPASAGLGLKSVRWQESFSVGPYNPRSGMPGVRWPSKPDTLPVSLTHYYKVGRCPLPVTPRERQPPPPLLLSSS